jgi:hypothetical protein
MASTDSYYIFSTKYINFVNFLKELQSNPFIKKFNTWKPELARMFNDLTSVAPEITMPQFAQFLGTTKFKHPEQCEAIAKIVTVWLDNKMQLTAELQTYILDYFIVPANQRDDLTEEDYAIMLKLLRYIDLFLGLVIPIEVPIETK